MPTTPAPIPSSSAPAAGRRTPAYLSSKSDNWPTPPDFFAALDAEFGFVLDVCASAENAKADAYYALDHADPTRRDGLAADWAADARARSNDESPAAWMNPPYGRPIGDWMAKAFATARAGATVVTLVPVRGDTAWWHDFVLATGAEVRYVRGRLTFGDAVNTAAFASAVVIFRPTDVVGAPGPVSTMPAHPGRELAVQRVAPAVTEPVTEPGDAPAETASLPAATGLSASPRSARSALRMPRSRAVGTVGGFVGGMVASSDGWARRRRGGQLPRVHPNRATATPAVDARGTVDCIWCHRHTRASVEHLFERRGWVEAAAATAGAHHA